MQQNGGGCNFITSLFGNDNKYINITQLIIEMIEQGDLEVANKLLIRGNFVPDMEYKDGDGNNLLHSLAKASCKSEYAKKGLYLLTQSGKNKKALNCRNKYGKQPLQYLTNDNDTDIMNYLINNGADVVSDIERDDYEDTYSIPMTIFSNLSAHDEPLKKPQKITNIFSKHTDSNKNDILKNIIREFNNNDTQQTELQQTDNRTIEHLSNLLNQQSEEKRSIQMNDTDKFVDLMRTMMEGNNNMIGGNKKITTKKTNANTITGTRRMRTYSELTEAYNIFGGSENDDTDDADDADGADGNASSLLLERATMSKASKYHKQALEKIQSLLEDKTDIILAKAIKAIIYGEIKQSKPELSNLDKSMETNKMITQEKVNEILKKNKDRLNEILLYLKNKQQESSNKSTTENDSSNTTN
jgi:hypothetical protein